MYDTLLQMGAFILCGIAFRILKPGGIDPAAFRRTLTTLVYYLLLPALVLAVLWKADIGVVSFFIAVLAAIGVVAGLLMGWFAGKVMKTTPAVTGAIILASSFPNVTYLGLPVLEASLGKWTRSIAIQYDLFACTPLLLTVGIAFAKYYGEHAQNENPWRELLKVPPLWAALLALALNLMAIPEPVAVMDWLNKLGNGVSVLMLISIGLSLQWNQDSKHSLPYMIPISLIQLVLVPLVVWGASSGLPLSHQQLQAIVLEAAMPSMVIGIVICDRYNLNTSLYATAVTVTTLFSFVSLPLWLWVLS